MHKAASLEQSRFKDKDALEMKKRKYPPSFDLPVDMKKIQFDVIKKWLASRVTELNSGQEDDTLVNYIIALLEEKVWRYSYFFLLTIRNLIQRKCKSLLWDFWERMLFD